MNTVIEKTNFFFFFFFFFLIVCFTSYFVLSIAVLPHSPEGIQCVKIIPIMNGLTILCTHKEWIASLLHHPHRDFVYILC